MFFRPVHTVNLYAWYATTLGARVDAIQTEYAGGPFGSWVPRVAGRGVMLMRSPLRRCPAHPSSLSSPPSAASRS
eukprot:7109015-Prymnesium_polylepis.1